MVWWFAECLTVVQAESQFTPLMDMLDADDEFRRFCGAYLRNVGTGINDLSIEKARIDADKVPKPFLDQLQPQQGQQRRRLRSAFPASRWNWTLPTRPRWFARTSLPGTR